MALEKKMSLKILKVNLSLRKEDLAQEDAENDKEERDWYASEDADALEN